jgi:hypothetical protein
MTMPVSGGTVTTLAPTQNGVLDIALDDKALYWSTAEHDSTTQFPGSGGTVVRLPFGASTPTTLVVLGDGDHPAFLSLHNDSVYFLQDTQKALYSVPKSGGTAVSLIELPSALSMAVTDTDAFAISSLSFFRAPLDGSPVQDILPGTDFEFFSTDGAGVVGWSDTFTSTVYAGLTSTGEAVPLASERGSALATATDSERVYWINGVDNSVRSATVH